MRLTPYIERGGLPARQQHGMIRLPAPQWDLDDALPRQDLPVATYRALAETFVTRLGLTPQ